MDAQGNHTQLLVRDLLIEAKQEMSTVTDTAEDTGVSKVREMGNRVKDSRNPGRLVNKENIPPKQHLTASPSSGPQGRPFKTTVSQPGANILRPTLQGEEAGRAGSSIVSDAPRSHRVDSREAGPSTAPPPDRQPTLPLEDTQEEPPAQEPPASTHSSAEGSPFSMPPLMSQQPLEVVDRPSLDPLRPVTEMPRRASPFGRRETRLLVQMMDEMDYDGRRGPYAHPKRHKTEVLQKISQMVAARLNTTRSPQQLRKRWSNLKIRDPIGLQRIRHKLQRREESRTSQRRAGRRPATATAPRQEPQPSNPPPSAVEGHSALESPPCFSPEPEVSQEVVPRVRSPQPVVDLAARLLSEYRPATGLREGNQQTTSK